MNTLSFLRLIWPESGIYLLAIPNSYVKNGELIQFHKHHAFTTIEAAAEAAGRFANIPDESISVFFALASVREDRTGISAQQRKDEGLKVRGGDNSDRVRAFWLDLDVGADPKKYATQQEAAEALRAFVTAMALPKPYIVSSGGGLHVYWPLTESIDARTWADHAAILKALTESYGLKADPSRTADVASVLRPVGTNNWKTGIARTVDVKVEGVTTSTAAMLHKLTMLQVDTQVKVHAPYVAPVSALGALPSHLANLIPAVNINEEAANGAGYAKARSREVVARCPQLMFQMDNPSLVTEPEWYAMIGCLRFTEGFHKGVHMMSRGHPQYSVQRTDDKIMQHEASGTGPTLCQTFEMHRPGGCSACPLKGVIKTPLQMVRALPEVAAPVVNVETADGVVELTLPPPPAPYKRVISPGCDAGRIAVRREETEGAAFDEVIYDYDLYPMRVTEDEREGGRVATLRMWLPHEGWRERTFPLSELYDKRSLAKRFGAMGILMDLGRVDEVTQYMIAYLRKLMEQKAADTVYAQLGWKDDKALFVLADRIVDAQGVTKIDVSPNIQNALSWQEPKGDLESWKSIVAIYERPGLEALQFGFGVGFAAPLFRFTNFNGAILSMVGKRGTGKSSAALCANSIWGHKQLGWMDMQHDTWKAFYGKIGAMNNLPVTYDEITNLDPEKISDLAYAITKGQGRQRLQTNGQAQENWGNWNTMMLTTSNASLHSRLSSAKADSSAEASRIFEYMVPENTLTKIEADANFDKLNDHFGVAGEVYAQALVSRRDWIRERVKFWIREVDVIAKVGSSERFWSAVAAAILAGFELANEAGLTNANIPNLLAFAVKQIHTMRGEVKDEVRAGDSILADYINSNMRSMLVLTSPAKDKTLATVALEPNSDKLRIRLERYAGRMYIDRADFRRFCQEKGADVKQVRSDLLESKVLMADSSKLVLGKGTKWSGVQTHCWVLDFTSPALSGVLESVQSAVDTELPPNVERIG